MSAPEVVHVADFLSEEERRSLLAAASAAAAERAHLLGRDGSGEGEARVRSTSRMELPEETRRWLRERLEELREPLAEHFGTELASFEDPQCLRYLPGDFFVAHQDGNTPLIHDASRHRRISAVLFLVPRSEAEEEGSYGGGSLVFHGRRGERYEARADPGGLVAFRSETTHEVTPVTHGERYTVVTWFRGPE